MEGAPSGSDFECVIITMENYGGRRVVMCEVSRTGFRGGGGGGVEANLR